MTRVRLFSAGRMGAIVVFSVVIAVVSAAVLHPSDAAPAATLPRMAQDVMRLDGHEYPGVVARVNGEPITGRALAQRVFVVKQSQAWWLDEEDPVRVALDQLVQDRVLRQAVQSRGLTASDAEVKSFIEQQRDGIAMDPAAQETIALLAQSLRVPEDQYWTDQRTVAAYRDILAVGKMREEIYQGLSPVQRADPAARQRAVEQFVAQSGARVEVLISQ